MTDNNQQAADAAAETPRAAFAAVDASHEIGAAAELAMQILAASFDMVRQISGLPAPQIPHVFAAALGAVTATGAADPEKGELFRAGLSEEDYGRTLGMQVRANLAIHTARIHAMMEATGAKSFDDLEAMQKAEAEAAAGPTH